MQFVDWRTRLDDMHATLPMVEVPLPNGLENLVTVSRFGVEGSWLITRTFPEFQIYGPWKEGHEQLWASLGFPSLAYFAAPNEDLSFLTGLNDGLRSLRLENTSNNEGPIEKCTNLRNLVLGSKATGALDLSALSRLRFLSSRYRGHYGLENLKSLESLMTGGPRHPKNLDYVLTLSKLRWLHVSESRRIEDLSAVSTLKSLEWLSLHGLSKVTSFPALNGMLNLKKLDVSNLSNSELNFDDLIQCPNLRAIQAFGVGLRNLDALRLRPDIAIGIPASEQDLSLKGKYEWLADRFIDIDD